MGCGIASGLEYIVARVVPLDARHAPQPLGRTPAVFDIGQSIDYVAMHIDGSVGTMATKNCVLWSLPDARALTCFEMAKLLGHDDTTNFSGLSEPQARKLRGMSLHVATTGLRLSCVLAGLGHGP